MPAGRGCRPIHKIAGMLAPAAVQDRARMIVGLPDSPDCRIADLPDCRIAGLPNCRIAGLPDCRIAGLPDYRIARLQDCRAATCVGLSIWLIYPNTLDLRSHPPGTQPQTHNTLDPTPRT
eukprot:8068317-Alexandrium_andersonii.AAC.1